jgi:hypothetical protein
MLRAALKHKTAWIGHFGEKESMLNSRVCSKRVCMKTFQRQRCRTRKVMLSIGLMPSDADPRLFTGAQHKYCKGHGY